MITVNTIEISSDATTIDVDITVIASSRVTVATLWTSANYKSSTSNVDLTSLLSNVENEVFSISLADAGVSTAFNGVFFLEFTETDAGDPSTIISTKTVAVSNLTAYYKCILDKVLNIKIENCEVIEIADCNKESISNINTIHTFLQTLIYALEQEDFLSIQDIENYILKLCSGCGCSDSTNTENLSGNRMTDDAVVSY